MKKVIDTREYVSVLRELTEQGETVSMAVAGSSMTPFLADERDVICFEKPKRQLKKGDMVFYQRANGQFVMHRICRIHKNEYYMIGDAQTQIEGPLPESAIFALVTKVKRKGRWIGPGDFWWFFFEKVWVRIIPARGVIRKIYTLLRRSKRERT